MTGLVWI